MMYLFTTVPHPHGHWQLQELLGNLTTESWRSDVVENHGWIWEPGCDSKYQTDWAHNHVSIVDLFHRDFGDIRQSCGQAETYISLSVLLFSKLNRIFFGHFHPKTTFLDSRHQWFSAWPNRYFGWKRSTAPHVADFRRSEYGGLRPLQR